MLNFESFSVERIQKEVLLKLYRQGKFFTTRLGSSKELLNVSVTLNSQDNITDAKSADYGYAADFLEYLLSGEPFLQGFKLKSGELFTGKYPHTGIYTSSKNLPEGFSTAYGPKIAAQLPKFLAELNTPNSRRATIMIVTPEDQQVLQAPGVTMEYPCLIAIQMQIRNGNLFVTASYRSNNIYKVLPYDLYLLSGITDVVLGTLNTDIPDANLHTRFASLTLNIGSAHYFMKDNDAVKKYLGIHE